MQFYKTDKSGKITEMSNEYASAEAMPKFVFEEGYLVTDRKIIADADGRLVFEDEIDLVADAQKKAAKEFAEAKRLKKDEAHSAFAAERDKKVWVNLPGGRCYGFDTEETDRVNFSDSRHSAELDGQTPYKVHISESEKAMVMLQLADFDIVFKQVRESQLNAYAWFEEIRKKIDDCESMEELEAVKLK